LYPIGKNQPAFTIFLPRVAYSPMTRRPRPITMNRGGVPDLGLRKDTQMNRQHHLRRFLPLILGIAVLLPGRVSPRPSTTTSLANQKTPVVHHARKASSPIVLDGILDEPAWDSALQFDLEYEVQPGENITPPVRTICMVTYTDRFIYFGFRAFDPDPSRIRARYSDRDTAWGDDWVGVVLDTFNDQRRAYEMFSTPLGVQIDAINDDVGGNYDDSWNAIWKSAGRITEEGYEVEMAIPFNQLRFQKVDGEQTWGFDALRSYPRTDRHHIGLFPRDRGNNSYLSQTVKLVGMEGANPGRNLEIIPTLTGSRSDTRTNLPEGTLEKGDTEGELGVSLRWGLTPNMSLNGAYNPDFSQVEADILQLGVNEQFALFFPETRPFFLEGADYFNTDLRLVHTRSIADPDSAVKLTAKQGRGTWGIFSADDAITNILVPGPEGSTSGSFGSSTLSSVGRYRYDFGANSTIGGMVTDRRGDGYANTVISADTVYRFTSADMVKASFALAATEYNDEMVTALGVDEDPLQDSAIALEYNHGVRNWWVNSRYEDFGKGFRSDLGFRPRVGYQSLRVSGARVWWGEKGDFFRRSAWGGAAFRSKQQSGDLLDQGVQSWFNFQGPRQSFVSVVGTISTRGFSGQEFDLWNAGASFNMQATADISLGLSAEIGDSIDFTNVQPAEETQLRPFIRYHLGRHLNLQYTHIFSALDVEGGRLFRVHAPELRVVHQFDTRTFIRAIFQYTDIWRDPSLYTATTVDERTRTLLTQLLFSYKVNPQTALYAGYTDNQLGNDEFDLTRTDRTFFLKLGYAWVR